MLFDKSVYVNRRKTLQERLQSGLVLLFGNNDSPCNYPANTYKFRQDSSFLYYYGQHRNELVGVIDIDAQRETLVGDEIDIDDIVWYGSVTSVTEMAAECGVSHTAPMSALTQIVQTAQTKGQAIHFLPPYRHDIQIQLGELLGLRPSELRAKASLPLIHAVVAQRSIKDAGEIAEIERACAIGYKMHTTAMRLCRAGVTERYIGGTLEGIAAAHGAQVSFQSIVSMHGEILHGYPSSAPLESGRLMLCDAGAETANHYCSDHTRTTPVSGKFTTRQKDIYTIVADCHDLATQRAKPGIRYKDVHLDVCRLMVDRLKSLGLMKGDTEEAVQAGAHALFLPHGLGHMLGMDVHDMEGLGQQYVGYNEALQPSSQFGLASLRLGRELEEGFVVTNEPGIYFIPDLIDLWSSQGTNADFLCFDVIETYKDFGGIRLEDDLLITKDGARYLGDQLIPYRPEDVEAYVAEHRDKAVTL